jgi:ABC-2 type transport system ATP-binding protein
MRLVGLENAMHRPLRSYSGGMLRRFEIARALLTEPQVLFMDEPTVGLDPQARARVWEVIEELRREGVTVFLTTHYMEEAEKLCDRVAIIDHGKIIAEGGPEELKGRVGGDTVYLSVPTPADANRLLHIVSAYGEARMAEDGKLVVAVIEDAPRQLPRILEEAKAAGVKVLEARYVRPTLNDVFLMLTGRSLRDEKGGWKDWMRLHIHARHGRG